MGILKRIAVTDIGGTHARFAVAEIEGKRVASLSHLVTLKTAEYPNFELALKEFGRRAGIDLPDKIAIALAGPAAGDVLKLTNNPWTIRPALIEKHVERYLIINDFGAVAHAVANLRDEHFRHVCGPDAPLPSTGVISIIGPGTGLGVSALLRKDGQDQVIETEGGHVDFAPLDSLDDQLLGELRKTFGRVSVERVASGPGLWNIYQALGAIEGQNLELRSQTQLWEAALAGTDDLAKAALSRLCLTLGAVAGDIALAQGAAAVVIAGGVGARIAEHLPKSGFRDRFIAKGRFQRRMDEMPVKLITYPEPGLFGAAAAFADKYQ